MNPYLLTRSAARGGWFTRADAIEAGYAESQIELRVRTGQWLRLCRDGYVEPADWPDEKSWDRARRVHILTAKAVYERAGAQAVLSHQTATVLHGLPDWGLDLHRVHYTKESGRAGFREGAYRHHAQLPAEDRSIRDALLVTSPARAVVEAACGASYEPAVALFDACVREGLATADQIVEMAEKMKRWTGAPAARAAARFIDGRSESVGESRLRVFLANHHFPDPQLQAELHDSAGHLVARVDFLLPTIRLVIEFDGRVKYDSGSDSVFAEKRREDRIRELGYIVLRVTWSDLDQPAVLAARIRQAIARASQAA